MTGKTGWIGALIALAVGTSAPIAAAQCCGDCNADGTVAVEELVGAVNHALDGCPSVHEPMIVLSGVSLPYLAATLGAEVTGGHVELAMQTDWGGGDGSDHALFAISAPNTWPSRVELLKNGEFLRLVVTETSGFERDVSVHIASLHPGAHTITASWGQGTAQLAVDDGPPGQFTIGDVLLAAGSDLLVGSPGASGTTFRRVLFDASLPAK